MVILKKQFALFWEQEKGKVTLSVTEVQVVSWNNVCHSYLLYSVFCPPGMDCAEIGGDLFGQRTDG